VWAFETFLDPAGYGSDAGRKLELEQKGDEFDWASAMNDEQLKGGTTTAVDAGIAMDANHFDGFAPRERSLILRYATLRSIR
jgi:hypothetical protein